MLRYEIIRVVRLVKFTKSVLEFFQGVCILHMLKVLHALI